MPSPKGAGLVSARRPALLVRPRHPDSAPGADEHDDRVDGLLDTGADVPAVPMWLLEQLGIPIDGGARCMIYSASGPLWAHGAKMGMEIQCNGPWLDIGAVNVIVPDTPWSRDPSVRRPILLGLNGFFDRVRMYIDHSREEFWLELPTGYGGAGLSGAPSRSTS